ncbi:MAG: VWA domain-containing protein, partial [Acidobacteria bacterium]|nr:VWA domain-containing protein [Acidobacteriota bacterium]
MFFLMPALVLFHWLRRRDRQMAALSFSRVQAFGRPGRWNGRTWLKVLRLCAMVLVVLAATRPQGARRWTEQVAEGIDIFLVLDISSSMSADDFFPNRLSVAKSVVQRFTEGRSQDRMGLIAFAAQSYPKCPLTLDHELLRAQLREIYLAKASEDGTAIGMALAGALARLRHSRSKNKVVILLTDGVNNRGSVAPLTAAAMA